MTAQSNNKSTSVPQWIDAKLFENVLKEIFDNFINIKEFTVKPALAPGENYATVILRIEIQVELKDLSTQSISFMLKVPNESEQVQEMRKGHVIFDVEKYIYDQIIPEFENMYADVGVKVKFGAKSYDLPLNKSYILLENLGMRGFKNVNRLEGLDVEHSKCVLSKLAQWHAASAVFAATKGPFEKKYTEAFFREESKDLMKTMLSGMNKIFICFAKTYNNYKEYADDIHSGSAAMIDEFFKVAKTDPNEFNVLNHGDCWSNNIMFQYDAFGKIKETYFVDYQIPKYGTPAQDLFYILLSSTKYEIKVKEFDYFIKFYHDQLIENLKLLKYSKKTPSLGELHTMMYKYGVWGFSTVTGIMAIALLDPTNIANIEHLAGDTDSGLVFKTLMYSNDRYRKHAELVLPWLKNRGALCF